MRRHDDRNGNILTGYATAAGLYFAGVCAGAVLLAAIGETWLIKIIIPGV